MSDHDFITDVPSYPEDVAIQVHNTTIPTSIAKAVLAVQTDLGILGKDDKNPFAKFNYVSIDKYYEIVARTATRFGLSWFCSEVGSTVVPIPSQKDQFRVAIRFDYMFTMFHEDGSAQPCYDRISIYHPLQGAQTSGAAASYAEKLFMRKAFKVVTGEKDADASPGFDVDDFMGDESVKDEPASVRPQTESPTPPVETPQPDPVPKQPTPESTARSPESEDGADGDLWNVTDQTKDRTPEDYVNEIKGVKVLKPVAPASTASWSLVAKVFATFLPKCETVDELKQFWILNTKTLELMKEHAGELHKDVVKAFTERQKTI